MSSADLIVYKTEYSSQARGNRGLWYFEEYSSRADKTILRRLLIASRFESVFYRLPKSRDGEMPL